MRYTKTFKTNICLIITLICITTLSVKFWAKNAINGNRTHLDTVTAKADSTDCRIPITKAIDSGLIAALSQSNWLYRLFYSPKQIAFLKRPFPQYAYPEAPRYMSEVNRIFDFINMTRPASDLSLFTSFYNRYYKSKHGVLSAEWLYSHINSILTPGHKQLRPTITKVRHKGWDQFSIVVSIPGSHSSQKVVLGSHQDSANIFSPNSMKAPGADDDGLGTVTVLETLRLIIQAGASHEFRPYHTLEFHFYSAEEGGLLGSQDIFRRYADSHKTVIAMLQQDMTGYTALSRLYGIVPHFGLITDYTSVSLNRFVKSLIERYNSIPVFETQCGYACSDHASALEYGFPASFLIESEMRYTSKFVHTTLDTIDRIDWEHMEQHVRLLTAFVYELSMAKEISVRRWPIRCEL